MKGVVIYGTGWLEIARLIDAINQGGSSGSQYRILGFLNDLPKYQGVAILGRYPVLGGKEVIPGLVARGDVCFVNNFYQPGDRREIARVLEEAECEVISVIHPGVDLSYVTYGIGCIIPQGCVVGPEVRLGRYVACRNGALVLHNSTVGNFSFIGPGAVLCGFVTLKEGSFIGAGATVVPRVTIGAGSVIGAGATVTKDIPSGAVAYGVPARVVRRLGST